MTIDYENQNKFISFKFYKYISISLSCCTVYRITGIQLNSLAVDDSEKCLNTKPLLTRFKNYQKYINLNTLLASKHAHNRPAVPSVRNAYFLLQICEYSELHCKKKKHNYTKNEHLERELL